MNSDGFSRLAGVIGQRAKDEMASPPVMELGYIQSDFSLKTDFFDRSIPSGEYLQCGGVTINQGSRVLVAWIGSDPIIIDVVVT